MYNPWCTEVHLTDSLVGSCRSVPSLSGPSCGRLVRLLSLPTSRLRPSVRPCLSTSDSGPRPEVSVVGVGVGSGTPSVPVTPDSPVPGVLYLSLVSLCEERTVLATGCGH